MSVVLEEAVAVAAQLGLRLLAVIDACKEHRFRPAVMQQRIEGFAVRDWDDVRYFLSVATNGSTLAAGRALRTSQSTVFRRIQGLEKVLGVHLFERRASGYALTAAGEALLPAARRIEADMLAFDELAARERRSQVKVVRFSAPDGALEYMLPTVMAAFREQYPEVRLEIIVSPRQLDLASGEADVALRANPAPDPSLFGRRLVEERPQLAASVAYAERRPLPQTEADIADHDVIALSGILSTALGEWFGRVVSPGRIVLQPDGIPSTLSAAKSGLGLAVLPQFIVDREPGLVASPLSLPLPSFDLWVLTHERTRKLPPVKVLMDLVANYVVATSSRATD